MVVRRYAALAAVIAAGGLCAAPFYKSGERASAGKHDAAKEEGRPWTAQKPELPHIAIETDGGPEARSPVPPDEAAARLQLPQWCQPTPISVPLDGAPLPMLPQLPIVRRASASGATIHEPDLAPVMQQPAAAAQPRPLRRHRIVDGDSLPVLALRYLGDEGRSEEIATINRDVLCDPNLLPVGKEILIPRDVAAAPPP